MLTLSSHVTVPRASMTELPAQEPKRVYAGLQPRPSLCGCTCSPAGVQSPSISTRQPPSGSAFPLTHLLSRLSHIVNALAVHWAQPCSTVSCLMPSPRRPVRPTSVPSLSVSVGLSLPLPSSLSRGGSSCGSCASQARAIGPAHAQRAGSGEAAGREQGAQ